MSFKRIDRPAVVVRRTAVCAVFASLLATSTWGQAAPVALTISAEEKQAAFLFQIAAMEEFVQKQALVSPTAAALEAQGIQPFQISVDDLHKMQPLARAARADLLSIMSQQAAQRPAGQIDSATFAALQALGAKRLDTIRAAMDKVKAALPAAAWNRLQNYLTNVYYSKLPPTVATPVTKAP